MNAEYDAILQELIKLDAKQRHTGRMNYKRYSEIQTRMLNISIETTRRALDQAERALDQSEHALDQSGAILSKYAELKEITQILIYENTSLYSAYQILNPEVEIYRC